MIQNSKGHDSPSQTSPFMGEYGRQNRRDHHAGVEIELNDRKTVPPFDPFESRNLPNPTSNASIFVNFVKAAIGTGILCMPKAFLNSGYFGCTLVMVIVAIVCTHCERSLVKCAHVLYYRDRKNLMTYAEVAHSALLSGPQGVRVFSSFIRPIIAMGLFLAYFFTCSAYTVIVAKNIGEVCVEYSFFGDGVKVMSNNNLRVVMAILMVPMVIVSMVPDLKKLAFLSILATICLFAGLGCMIYIFVTRMTGNSEKDLGITQWGEGIGYYPETFSICIFAVEAIGCMMPFENSMKTPKSLVSTFGILNVGMVGITFSYLLFGSLGYLSYGNESQGNISGNLNGADKLSQVIRILIALAVYFSFTLQFFVCLEVVWNAIKKSFTKQPMVYNYILRVILVVLAVLVAIAVPNILPLVGLIGAFCFSILGIIVPAIVEIGAYWEEGNTSRTYLVIKNILLVIFGVFILVFGTYTALVDIKKSYA